MTVAFVGGLLSDSVSLTGNAIINQPHGGYCNADSNCRVGYCCITGSPVRSYNNECHAKTATHGGRCMGTAGPSPPVSPSCGSEGIACCSGACNAGLLCSAGVCRAPSCNGTTQLLFNPSSVAPAAPTTPTVGGLSNCDNKQAQIRQGSCSGAIVGTCVIGTTGQCVSSLFNASSVPGSYSYYACVDKNANGNFDDAGEQGVASLSVQSCGNDGQVCCSSNLCGSGLACQSGVCKASAPAAVCQRLAGTGSGTNFVIVPCKFQSADYSTYAAHASKIAQSFASTQPYSVGLDKFSVYQVNDFAAKDLAMSDEYICHNSPIIQDLARKCGVSSPIIISIVNGPGQAIGGSPTLTSLPVAQVPLGGAYSATDSHYIALHETGHILGLNHPCIESETVRDPTSLSHPGQCSSVQGPESAPCPGWEGAAFTSWVKAGDPAFGCFKGCANNDALYSAWKVNSIMCMAGIGNTGSALLEFSPVERKMIADRLGILAPSNPIGVPPPPVLCNGSVQLLFNPSSVYPSQGMTPTVLGLSGSCAGRIVQIKNQSCAYNAVGYCTLGSDGRCVSSLFNASSAPGLYTYIACADLNGDGSTSGVGERGVASVSVISAPIGVPPSPSCLGSTQLLFNPSNVSPSAATTPTVTGLSNCANKVASIRLNGCTGSQVGSCTINSVGQCVSSLFYAPSAPASYNYYACVDKNANGNFNDAGEQGSAQLNVQALSCGASGQACCSGSVCNSGLSCVNNMCQAASVCSGTTQLLFNPSSVSPSAATTPTVTGLSNCANKVASIRLNGCTGSQVGSCTIDSMGQCVSSLFYASSIASSTYYYACVDKNGNGNYNDAGEQGYALLTVQAPTSTCAGTTQLLFNPSSVSPSQATTPTVTGLSNCANKQAQIRLGGCSGMLKGSCTISSSGQCVSSLFYAESSASTSYYYACVDKNANGNFNDAGEQGYAALTVTQSCAPSYYCDGSYLYYRSATCGVSYVQYCSYGCNAGSCMSGPVPPPAPSPVPPPAPAGCSLGACSYAGQVGCSGDTSGYYSCGSNLQWCWANCAPGTSFNCASQSCV